MKDLFDGITNDDDIVTNPKEIMLEINEILSDISANFEELSILEDAIEDVSLIKDTISEQGLTVPLAKLIQNKGGEVLFDGTDISLQGYIDNMHTSEESQEIVMNGLVKTLKIGLDKIYNFVMSILKKVGEALKKLFKFLTRKNWAHYKWRYYSDKFIIDEKMKHGYATAPWSVDSMSTLLIELSKGYNRKSLKALDVFYSGVPLTEALDKVRHELLFKCASECIGLNVILDTTTGNTAVHLEYNVRDKFDYDPDQHISLYDAGWRVGKSKEIEKTFEGLLALNSTIKAIENKSNYIAVALGGAKRATEKNPTDPNAAERYATMVNNSKFVIKFVNTSSRCLIKLFKEIGDDVEKVDRLCKK